MVKTLCNANSVFAIYEMARMKGKTKQWGSEAGSCDAEEYTVLFFYHLSLTGSQVPGKEL